MKDMNKKQDDAGCAGNKEAGAKKPFEAPRLTKYGTVKDVYKGPSCKAVLGYTDDK